ncbi:HDOD domain-containing protein [Catenovulum sp. 2E275]|uniref:HDOD domain-containing protein n=1 Tax=Catenovulum sp. 2E275 TaxID=2980497 RepID=UPI0021D2A2B6|nr:HDOD domain-containing protein [Catenovulum sp. 2E275]MCU4674265.1 HDOD domain-containing protein [Catenovulum sp. 2E275]
MSGQSYSDLLHTRFHDLLISYDFARSHNGLGLDELDLLGEEQVQQRQLLDIEQQAKSERIDKAKHKQANQAQQSIELNKKVSEMVLTQLDDMDLIYQDVLQIQDAVPAILDILTVRAASIGRVEPLVSSMPWLTQDMIKFVNLPIYRKQEDGKKPIRVDRCKTALGYIGIDNLKLVVPSFALRKWLPHSTEPFRLMKRKLWESALGTGIACRRLAQLNDQDPSIAFALGVFHDLGKSAIVRLYLRTFDLEWKQQLKAARDMRKKDLHDALVDLEPKPETLRDLLLTHSAPLSLKLLEKFNLKRLNLAQPLAIYLSGKPDHSDSYARANSEMAEILKKGICYARYKVLQRHGLIAKHEAKIFFKENKLTATEIKELTKLSLIRLNLRLVQQD